MSGYGSQTISAVMVSLRFLLLLMVRGSFILSLRSLEKYGVSIYSSKLAEKLSCEIKHGGAAITEEAGLILQENEDDGAIELAWGIKSGLREVPFRIDFASATSKQRAKLAKSELVSRAIGSKTSHVIDLTAGLGRDSFILASSGYNVCLIERNPVMFYLLSDAIQRLRSTKPEVAARMNLFERDSKETFSLSDLNIELKEGNAVSVYLDPMYEGNVVGKRSNVKKETAMLHRLVSDDSDGMEQSNILLFESAKRLSTCRIIVKRAGKAGALANAKPHEAIEGSTHRFDIYFQNRSILDAVVLT